MKKLLCALIFCLSFSYTFAWIVQTRVDEFGDLTEQKELFLTTENKTLSISENDFGYILVVGLQNKTNSPRKSIEGIVRVKIDNSQPFELINSLIFFGYGFASLITEEQLNLFANGKIAKFYIPELSQTERFDLTGLEDAIKRAGW